MAARDDQRPAPARSPPRSTPSKATLFCPDCGHRSRVDGDWTVVETGGERRYRCPDCTTTITVRPAFDADGAGRSH